MTPVLAKILFLEAIEPAARAARSSGSNYSSAWLVGTVVAVAVAWVFVFYGDKLRRRWHAARSQPLDLFDDLCEAHRLSKSERDQLRQFAAAARLPRAAVLFVDPAHLTRFSSAPGPTNVAAAELLRKLFQTS